ncbi:MAG: SagB/ThcOx family dehydrogenase, partial [Thermodesulfobacteriota bacterium]
SFVAYDFDDHRVNRLLGLDEKREGAIACIGINGETAFRAFDANDMAVAEPTAAVLSAGRVSRREVFYEEIGEIHSQSCRCVASVGVPRIGPDDLGLDVEAWKPVGASGGPADHPWKMSGTGAMIRRRSCRNFVPEHLSRNRLEAMLDMVCRAYPPPGLENPDAASHVVCTGFLCRNVESLEEGFYLIDPVGRRIGRVRAGALTKAMADACLNQAWLKNAALHFVFMTCLDTLHKHRGARGYRYAMMSAGRLGHEVYLAATALGLGCCGIGAFYDNEAESLMGINASSALLYLAAAGPVR